MVKSIFDLESRIDFDTEYLRLMQIIDSHTFLYLGYSDCTFNELINEIFHLWPYRLTAINIFQYFELKGINWGYSAQTREDKLYTIQFILDFIYWINSGFRDSVDKKYHNTFKFIKDRNEENFSIIIDNLLIIIENINLKIEIIKGHITFVKKDADVDSVLIELSNDTDIRMLLLSYNDFSIEKDIEKKRKILFDLGAWLEPQRTKYASINSNLTSDIFNVLNNGSIRHNNSKQWSFSSEEDKLKMYDDLFKMIIHLIRQEDIKKIHDKISSFNV